MNFELDGGKVLYVLGVLFALGALLYFARDVVFGLSITVTAALLFAAFVAFLVAGLTLERDVLDVVAYAVAGLSYAVFLGYVATRYTVDETGVFLLLSASAALFVGLGYGVRRQRLDVGRRAAGYVVVGIVAVSFVFVGADVVTGDVQYSVELDDETTVDVPQTDDDEDRVRAEATVGTLTVTNPSPFARPVDLPSAAGCVVGTDVETDQVPVRYEPRSYDVPDRIDRNDERTHELELHASVPANETGEMTYAVERGSDCDVDREAPTVIVMFEEDGDASRPV
ncbi:hypothetical protein [Natrarchaeobaculum sulfurireducens]|uniref:DUF1109 domain-containing protein n=1 Tax=Natrarchaeobaculum sulfurireducens TaxID=2044521 RepID=A0A346PFX9_9EURY|nr:hypothetical protein [Natrarchaeobaculum sulfurireducens]AXR78424.1 hypothetical protein AArc1_2106 [Natrarchaeobaculum sulfurireducens]